MCHFCPDLCYSFNQPGWCRLFFEPLVILSGSPVTASTHASLETWPSSIWLPCHSTSPRPSLSTCSSIDIKHQKLHHLWVQNGPNFHVCFNHRPITYKSLPFFAEFWSTPSGWPHTAPTMVMARRFCRAFRTHNRPHELSSEPPKIGSLREMHCGDAETYVGVL